MTATTTISRRHFTKGLIFSIGSILAGCTPVKIILKAYPKAFRTNRSLQEDMLRLFALTIVPGADLSDPKSTNIYFDTYYPFAEYVPFFLSDVNSRANADFGGRPFTLLSQGEREKLILDAIQKGDAVTRKLYLGAIYMTRANVYAGIYNDNVGCPHIGFHGTSQEFKGSEMYYPNANEYFAHSTSYSGNPS